jgi:hypothetical protein
MAIIAGTNGSDSAAAISRKLKAVRVEVAVKTGEVWKLRGLANDRFGLWIVGVSQRGV